MLHVASVVPSSSSSSFSFFFWGGRGDSDSVLPFSFEEADNYFC